MIARGHSCAPGLRAEPAAFRSNAVSAHLAKVRRETMQRSQPNRSGFTLIELLVVIAIIAILAAILFPVFAQARAKARQAACLSNQKQIGLAFQQYIQDYDETFPPSDYDLGTQKVNWVDLADPYIKSGAGAKKDSAGSTDKEQRTSVFVCPQIDSSIRDPAFPEGASYASKRALLSYAANRYLMPAYRAGAQTPETQPVSSLAAVEAPASLVILAPNHGGLPQTYGRDDRYNLSSSQHEAGYMNARTRHSDGANFTFADGHAKWFKGPSDYRARSTTGVVWQRCEAPSRFANASGWFAPLSGSNAATASVCQ
jgi:prepilin-type N-terminal cleavage/methylation domain-containing protein/prepilin-type processing-associated H-X9-DG protein